MLFLLNDRFQRITRLGDSRQVDLGTEFIRTDAMAHLTA
jgi:hypothetical protein